MTRNDILRAARQESDTSQQEVKAKPHVNTFLGPRLTNNTPLMVATVVVAL